MRSIVLAVALSPWLLAAAATPDQVLVLYNADYKIDQDGSEPGQDSKEVAEYYVRRHTDPATGKKPWILGLSCVHGKDHLGQFRLLEDSHDNYCGIEYVGAEEPPKEWPVYDSRGVQFVLTKDELAKVDPASITIAAGKKADRADAKTVFKDNAGAAEFDCARKDNPDGSATWSLNARKVATGIVHVWFDAKGKDGQVLRNIHLVFHDFNDFIESTTGRDRIRDDKNYVDDVERQVQDFLEDPKNAPDAQTPLRDHILYIVVCHGLPKAVESLYGIFRGSTDNLGDCGDGSSLEQRLMVMYYNPTAMDYAYAPGPNGSMQRSPVQGGTKPRFTKIPRVLPRNADGVQRAIIANSLVYGLVGAFNPYQHPMTFRAGQKGNDVPDLLDQEKYADPASRLLPVLEGQPPHFSTELRRTWPKTSFLYWAMRVDGPTPEIAKAQIDGAIYGNRHFTPAMGTCYNRLAGPLPIQPSVRLGIDELKELGFKLQPKLNEPPPVIARPLICSAFFSDGPRYLDEGEIAGQDGVPPGGIVYAIKSGNGWKQGDDQFATYFQKMVEAGATVTAGLGAQGGAHITSASWWDDRVLFHHLFRGWELGESLLMSTIYLDWVTGYVGDPLYRPNLRETKPDTTPPAVQVPGIAAEVLPAKDCYCAVLSAELRQTPENPEMAEMTAEYGWAGEQKQTAWGWRFSARPHVVLRGLKPGSTCDYSLTLTDAYGNATKVQGSLRVPEAAPSKLRDEQKLNAGEKAKPLAIAKLWKKDAPPALTADAGEIEMEFTAKKERFRIVELNGLAWSSERFRIGGGTALTHEPLKFEAGKRYHLAARWRRRPLTREVYLIDPDGKEHLAACNNIVPWQTRETVWGETHWGDRDGDVEIHSVRIFDNANPAPDENTHPYVKRYQP